MDKYITYTVKTSEDGWQLGRVLQESLELTTRQIRRLKFTPGGINVTRNPKGVSPIYRGKGEKDGPPTIEGESVTEELVTVRTVIHINDVITVFFREEEETLLPVEGPVEILYADEDLIFLNKPAGLVCHPSSGHYTDSLANRLTFLYHEPVRLIGRLDKDTSGVVLAARNLLAAERLENKAAENCSTASERKIQKIKPVSREYLALVQGELKGEGVITTPLQRHKCPDRFGLHGNPLSLMRAVAQDPGDGRGEEPPVEAVTHWKSLEIRRNAKGEAISLISLWLETGRMHQIRCHMASLDHPLVGDGLYGDGDRQLNTKAASRTMLHSYKMEVIHPFTRDHLTITVDPPKDFQNMIKEYSIL